MLKSRKWALPTLEHPNQQLVRVKVDTNLPCYDYGAA